MIVLDEPTAAIDPIEETRIYGSLQKYQEDGLPLLLPTVWVRRIADRIVVMDHGQIVESEPMTNSCERKEICGDV